MCATHTGRVVTHPHSGVVAVAEELGLEGGGRGDSEVVLARQSPLLRAFQYMGKGL